MDGEGGGAGADSEAEAESVGVLGLLQQHLLLAVLSGNVEAVWRELGQGARAGGPGDALICAVAHHGSVAVASALLAAQPPALPDAFDASGKNAVHRCCQMGRAAVLQVLLAAGGDAALPAKGSGWRPLHFAAKHAMRPALAGVSSSGSAKPGFGSDKDAPEEKRGGTEEETDGGELCCLGSSSEENANRRIAEALIDFGGPAVFLPCALGETALDICARYDNAEVARVILGAALELGLEATAIASALRIAAASDARKVAVLLVAEAGGDIFAPAAAVVNLKSVQSVSPLDAARSHGNHKLARLILEASNLYCRFSWP